MPVLQGVYTVLMTTTLQPPTPAHVRTAWPRLLTAADLARPPTSLPGGDVRYELADGILVIHSPPTGVCGRSQALALSHLHSAEARGVGKLLGRAGVILRRNPDRVVGPAVSLIGRDQWPPKVSPEDFLETIPKLVVEIRSKNDTLPEIESKIAEYLAAGVVEVWVLDPEDQTVAKHHAEGVQILTPDQSLTSDLLLGFNVSVALFFAD